MVLSIAVPINVQEELEEEVSPDEEPPVDEEEDTIRICTPEGERNVTIEELQELIGGGADFSIPAQNEVCVITAPTP